MTIFNLLTFIGGLAMFLFGMSYMGTMMLVLAMVLIWSVAIVKIAADVEKNEQRYKAKEARTKNFNRRD